MRLVLSSFHSKLIDTLKNTNPTLFKIIWGLKQDRIVHRFPTLFEAGTPKSFNLQHVVGI